MRLTTTGLIVVLSLGLLTTSLPTAAQQSGKVYRIGWLGPTTASKATRAVEVFLEEMRALGWVEDEQFVMEYQWAEGQNERYPELVAELARRQVDVIVVYTTPGTKAAVQATQTIPIVFTAVVDPVQSGIVASLAHPGANATGTAMMGLGGKRLQMLQEVVPRLARVAVLWEATNPGAARSVRQMQGQAQQLDVTFLSLAIHHADEIEPAFRAMRRERADALIVPVNPLVFENRERIAKLALKHQLPTIASFHHFPRVGGLMSYAANLTEYFRRPALYVDKILKGASPADLPVERPVAFELIINLKTAEALGLTVSPSLLLQADEVIR
jgi:putative ABC transport system substrate-binding protein